VQFILPAEVSMIAIGSGVSSALAAGDPARRGAVVVAGFVCDHTDRDNMTTMIKSPTILRMRTPSKSD
jgi:hypothetical protein